jgi:hypothetical protein
MISPTIHPLSVITSGSNNGEEIARAVSRQSISYGAFHYGTHPPPLHLAQRSALFNHHYITDIASVIRIIGHKFHPASNEFAVKFMPHHLFNQNDNTLVHLIADYRSDPGLL